MTAYTSPGAWYVSSAAWSLVSAWAASHSYSAGALVRQNAAPTVGNERVFACIVAGTSGASEPTWVVTKGAKTTDSSVTWIEVTGQPGVNGDTTNSAVWQASKAPPLGMIIYDSTSGALQVCTTASGNSLASVPTFSATAGVTTNDSSNVWTSLGAASGFAAWAAPARRGAIVFATNWGVAGNDFYFADNHAESQTTALTFNPPGANNLQGSRCLSVDHTAGVPPAGVKSGATVTASSAGMTINSAPNFPWNYFYGITFATSAQLTVGDITGSILVFDTCGFDVSIGTSSLSIGNSTPGVVVWNNCTVKFGATTSSIRIYDTNWTWRNTANAVLGTTIPTSLITLVSGNMLNSTSLIEGVDLSAITTNLVYGGSFQGYVCFKDCKLGSGVTIAANLSGNSVSTLVDVIRCDSGGTNYQLSRFGMQGQQVTSTSVVRTGGATDGATPVSHQIGTGTFLSTWYPYSGIPITVWNTTTAANLTVTLHGVALATSLPTNADLWFDVEYLGASGNPLGSFVSGGLANVLSTPSNLTADTASAWSSKATARGNSTNYTAASGSTLGDVISVSSAPAGMIFFCTASGSSAGSVPGAYGSAVDGQQITDGTATFTAGYRFKLTLTLSAPQPAQAGYLYVYPKSGQASSIFFLDPLAVLV